MKFNIVTGVAAVALALSTAGAFAQTQQGSAPGVGDGRTLTSPGNQYSIGAGAAQESPHVGDGRTLSSPSNQYNIGAGAAQESPHVGDGRTLTPPSNQYNVGSGAAQTKDHKGVVTGSGAKKQ